MIIAKVGNEYINDKGDKIPAKEKYLKDIEDAEAIEEPSNEELIELGKKIHPFYKKSLIIENAQNNIAELTAFDLADKPIDIIKK